MLRTNADYLFGPEAMKVIPLNADLRTPLPLSGGAVTTLKGLGGIGPFDFSGVGDISDVEFKIKINETEDAVVSIDLTAAVSQAAVTAAEMVTSITAALYTGITPSVDSRGYLEIDVDTPGTDKYLQVYGEGAELSEYGQGYGLQFVILNTQQSASTSPTLKDAETNTIVDSNGLETEVIADQYRKGSTGVIVDTARDQALRAIVEGGTYDVTNDFYAAPTSEDTQKYFAIETVRPVYLKGTNKQADLVGYRIERTYTCVGSVGDDAGDRNFAPENYNFVATSYSDPETRAVSADWTTEQLTKAAFEALDWYNI